MKSKKVFIDEFKGHNIFAVWEVDENGNKCGEYPRFSFGIRRAQEYLPVLEFAEELKAFIETETQAQAQKNFTYKPGDRIEIKTWLAKKLGAQANIDIFFRNLEITQVLDESVRGVNCKIKFVSEVASACHICGLPLDTEISRACGIGPVCCGRLGIDRPDKYTAPQILAKIEEYAKKVGEIGPFWIAKSQIKDKPNEATQERLNTDPQLEQMRALMYRYPKRSPEHKRIKDAIRAREKTITEEVENAVESSSAGETASKAA